MAPSASDAEYAAGSSRTTLVPPPQFRKHKALPHPSKERWLSAPEPPAAATRKDALTIETAVPKKYRPLQPVHLHASKQRSKRIGGGPDLPPTPPAHSRTSSSSQSIIPSSPTYVASPARSTEDVRARPPVTPPSHRSPPTPDVTPPQPQRLPERLPERLPKAQRPAPHERIPSKSTTVSRADSFKTAPEVPDESDQDDGQSTLRPALPSPRASQNTVRTSSGDGKMRPKVVGLGLGLESNPDENATPRAKREFINFDGEWGSDLEVEQEWDANLMRNVTVRKRRPAARANGKKTSEVVEDVTVSPTNAAKAVRGLPLQGKVLTYVSPNDKFEPIRRFTEPSHSDYSATTDPRRSSGMSSKSTVSTVVEAILIETPPGPPQRQKTLRHMKKLDALRESSSDLSHAHSASPPENVSMRRYHTDRAGDPRYHSIASAGTTNSVSSRKARREVWKNGGIPVVVVPDRQSSVKSSREPSLRSTSSRKSKRSQSLSLAPLTQIPKDKDLTPFFERPSRHGRTMSGSDGSASGDQRTMDYPPVVPVRRSSLSAPTSRNPSRAGSLTSESLKAHNELLAAQQNKPAPVTLAVNLEPAPSVKSSKSVEDVAEDTDHRSERAIHTLSVDAQGDPLFGSRLTAQVTPFSQYSVDTNATSAAEISEAMAVSISQHQNKSVLMIDHRPSEGSDGDQRSRPIERPEPPSSSLVAAQGKASRPMIMTTDTDMPGPVTPPRPDHAMDDVDSPLRNPRDPPEPPALKFIPATPSGLTPAQEKDKQLGNFYEEVAPKPARSASLVRRALSKRRHSEHGPTSVRLPAVGFLARTLSLSKKIRKETGENPTLDGPVYDDEPADETRLHPFWRPAYPLHLGQEDDDVEGVYDIPAEEIFKYPLIDNRPRPPRRSLSTRLKRTFAILPLEDRYDDFLVSARETPERRTIRRTSSGNLRVTRRSGATPDSVRQVRFANFRPYMTPDRGPVSRRHHFWWSRGLTVEDRKKMLLSLGNRVKEGYGLNNLTRRLSERRREKRSQELRQKISGPREVRDGVGDVIRRNSYWDAVTQAQPMA